MSAKLTNIEFRLLRKYIEEQCGIVLGDDKAYLIESRLSRLLVNSGLSSFDQLYRQIRKKQDPKMVEKLIDAITTNETLWFRDKSPWAVLTELLLPRYVAELRAKKRNKVRIWSAASSTGQEPYSTAMCIDNYLRTNSITDVSLQQFEIIATDISPTVLQIAQAGRYDSISIMRGLDEHYKSTYFSKDGRTWLLADRIKQVVTFRQFNLQNSYLMLGKFDVVFCRYVLIYFSKQLKHDVLHKISRVLNHKGVLFIGNSEILNEGRDNYIETSFENSVFYEVRANEKDTFS